MNNIFLDCSIQHIKINRSNLYITRMHFMYSVNGEYSSCVKHIESNNPTENSLTALDLFNIELNNFYKLFPNEVFSKIVIKNAITGVLNPLKNYHHII